MKGPDFFSDTVLFSKIEYKISLFIGNRIMPDNSEITQSNDPQTASQEYLPARMVNEFVYCPRLFFLEHVDQLFANNADTIEGAFHHRRVDRPPQELPKVNRGATAGKKNATSTTDDEATGDSTAAQDVKLHARSVTLSSDQYHILAKLDLVEATGTHATPIDYKRGRPRQNEDGSLSPWEPEQVQICVQALVLRDNGYECREGIIYFAETKQRVVVPITDELIERTRQAIDGARHLMAQGNIPLPLVDSPKCPRCSLVGICLPDETLACQRDAKASEPALAIDSTTGQRLLFDAGPGRFHASLPDPSTQPQTRQLVTKRDERRPLYVNTPGLTIGKSGEVIQVKEQGRKIMEVRMFDTSQVNLMGPIQISTQCLHSLMQAEIPVGFFSMGGWFYGITQGIGLKNIFTRREQFRRADDPYFCVQLARLLVGGKIRNSRVMLMRNHIQPPVATIGELKKLEKKAMRCESLSSLLGIEGTAAAVYFSEFQGMIKVGGTVEIPFDPMTNHLDDRDAENKEGSLETTDSTSDDQTRLVSSGPVFCFDFPKRNRRPPRDPVNALLSLAYSLLAKELTIACAMVGLDPYLGYYHQPRYGRPALALDLMEPFRPLIAESAVLTAINNRMVQAGDFIQAGDAVSLKPAGRKNFFLAFESRMDTLVTHPMFGYRVSYRRMLEIQTRLLARLIDGEIPEYPVFITR
jgi:CRISPR-associated protein Cas1